jgi:NAD(P)-dependent dehydrogenase (short-subunit alcohol dehydrogenase family)
MNGSLTGKVAFVTGAGGGIGRATAMALAREGASVVVADVSEKNNQETARMIEEQGRRALAVRCDVTRAEDVQAALDKTIEAFGRLDVAFNNAGIEPRKPAPTADYELEEWDRIIEIDLRGVFLSMKYEIPLMLKHGGGRDREHLLGCRHHWHQRQSSVHRGETWRDRPYQGGCPRLRRAEYSR